MNREIIEAIRKIVGDGRMGDIAIGEVTAVDEDTRTCSLTSTVDKRTIDYSDVRLSAENNDGLIQIPSIGSTVVFIKMPNLENYVISFTDIDKLICYIDSNNYFEFSSSGFVFNGGTLDGMVKVNSLVTKLNNIETLLNKFVTNINAWTPVPNDGGAALKTIFTGNPVTALTATVKANLENTKIKQ